MMLKSRENRFLFFMVAVFALEAIFFSIENKKINDSLKIEEAKIFILQNAFEENKLEAKAYSVYDGTLNKRIYGKNDLEILPIASLTKIMTVVVALNEHTKDAILTIPKEAIDQSGDYGFFVNEKFNIRDLAKFTLIGSANDGALSLVYGIDDFLIKMNQKAEKIGMKKVMFLNPTGLDVSKERAGAIAKAEDVNIMALFALRDYPEVFGASVLPAIKIESKSGFTHYVKNTNLILDKIPNILFSKTGFTPLAGGNLTIIYKHKGGHEIAITILGSTELGRFSDMEKLISTLDKVYNLP